MDERYLFFLRYYLTMLKQVYYVLVYSLSLAEWALAHTQADQSLFLSAAGCVYVCVRTYMLFTVIALWPFGYMHVVGMNAFVDVCVLAILVLFPSCAVASYVQWTVRMCWWMYTSRSERARARVRTRDRAMFSFTALRRFECFETIKTVSMQLAWFVRLYCGLNSQIHARTHAWDFDSIQFESAHSFFAFQ